MKKSKWRERFIVNGKDVRLIYLIHACARDLGLPLNCGKRTIVKHIYEKCPGVTGNDNQMLVHYASILDKRGVKVGRQPKAEKKFVYGSVPTSKPKSDDDFYRSREWLQLRYLALKNNNATCECCGARKEDGAILHVDHIKPRSKHPKLQLDLSNLQILCLECNLGKSNWDETDWRPFVD